MDGLGSLNIGALEFDPNDATLQTLVAGSARLSSFGAVGGVRIGVLRTTDGGSNWSVLGSATFANENLTSVAARGSIILAASDDQWGGGSGSGLFRSINTGGSFTLVSGSSGLPVGPVSDLVADPGIPTRFYAAVRTVGIFRSENSGATWTNVTGTITGITGTTTKVEMAVHNNGTTNAVYVAVINTNALASVWRSANLGVTWTRMDTPVAHNGPQGQIHFSIAADRNLANLVYIGGDRITSSPFTGNLFRGNASLALGSQFTTIMDGNANSGSGNTSPHADSREMVMDAGGNLLQGDDGGLYRRTSPGLSTGTWSSVIGNLACFEAHDVAYDSVANVAMIGTQDNGTHIQSASNSTIWTFISGGDGGDVAIDDTSTPNQSIRYGSSQNLGGFYRRTYNAANGLVSSASPALTVTGGGPAIGAQFATPVELNKVNPARLIIGGSNAAYESLDRGSTVTALTPISPVNGTFTGKPIAYGGYLAAVPVPDVLYYGSGSTVRLRTTAGGTVATTAAAFPGGTVQDIVLDRNDWRRVFVAGTSGVYFSPNSGASWTNITGNLTGVGSLHTLEFFRLGGTDCVAAGTDLGVYCCFVNNFGTWSKLGTGLPNAVVYDMTYSVADSLLVAGTMGRSTFRLSIELDSLVVTPDAGLTSTGLTGGPFNPAAQTYTLRNNGTVALNWTATGTQPWLRFSAVGGTLAPGASTTVTVSLKRGAGALAPGAFADLITFLNTTSGAAQTRAVSLTVSDPLGVSPAGGLTASGTIGGPFTPTSQVYTLTNNGTVALDWTATKTQPWLGLSATGGTLAPGANTTITATLNATATAALPLGAYNDTVTITNTTTSIIQTRPVTLNVNPPRPDYFTEIFESADNDTDNQSWLFTPDGSLSFYSVIRSQATAFPSDPTGGTTLPLTLDSFLQVTPPGVQVRLYGVNYSSFFVSSKGYVTMGAGDFTFTEALAAHFSLPRIAALFDDLDPSVAGRVSWKQFTDRIAVTWQNVPEWSATNSNNCQIEMFFDGRIRITCLAIAATDGLIGLSRGLGLPADFVESDFSAYPSFFLEVNPPGGLTANGLLGGPFTPSSQAYTLTNTSAVSLDWTAAKTQPWVSLSATGGTLAPGANTTVTVALNASAAALALGSYTDTVTFSDATNSQIQTRPVSLTVSDPLAVSPATGLTASGPIGGPFTPSAQAYVLTNNSAVPLTWTATKTQTWLGLSAVGGTLAQGVSTTVTVVLNAGAATLAVGPYTDTVTFRNVTSGVVQTRPVSLTVTPPVPDYFTEQFDTTVNDTDNQSWLFTPNGSNNFYRVVRTPVTTFPTTPAGGTTLTLSDDSSVQVTPTGGAQVRLYGVNYSTFFVGSNGYVTFGSGDTDFSESLTEHFALPRISALFDDLDPGSGGTVSWRQLTDRVAVTFQNVTEFSPANSNSFQIEMFFDGRIRITCLAIAATDGLIGLSRGLGLPADFIESDFNNYATSSLASYEDWITSTGIGGAHSGPTDDFDGDGFVNLLEWAFGTDPASSGPVSLSVTAGTIDTRGGPTSLLVSDGGSGTVRLAAFSRRKDYTDVGLTYEVEFSRDLFTWTSSADSPAVIADDGNIEIVTVPYPPLIDGQGADFFRIKVTAP